MNESEKSFKKTGVGSKLTKPKQSEDPFSFKEYVWLWDSTLTIVKPEPQKVAARGNESAGKISFILNA